jgi:hypothetical protein
MKRITALVATVLFVPGFAMAGPCERISRACNSSSTVNFYLLDTDGVDFKEDAAHASGDTVIMKDEGTPANTTNGFVDEGDSYSLALTATELNASRITISIKDQGTKAWLDTCFIIETYGTSCGQHNTTVSALASDTVTAASIAADAIGASEIAADAIGASEIATDAIGATEIAANAITSSEIADGAIDAGALASDTITAAKIAADAIGASEIAANAITSSELATDAIGSAQLAATAVTEIQTGLATSASISALNNISTADVNAQVLDVLATDTFAELSAMPSVTPTIVDMLRFVYQNNAFKKDRSNALQQLYKANGTTVLAEFPVSTDGTTTTFGAAVAP